MKFSIFAGVLGFTLAAAPLAQSVAANYPERPVTVVLPFAAGSPTDAVIRILADELGQRLDQPFIVQNRPGATGMIGSEYVARAKADGYTLLFGTNTTQVANKYFFKNIPYDGVEDFDPIAVVGGVPHALVVNPSLPVNSVDELIQYAKAHPGEIFFPYANSTTRITAKTLRVMADIDIADIPYKAYGQAVSELLGGQTQLMFLDFATGMGHMKSGALKPLAITPERSEKLPGVPAMKEVLPGFEIGNWNGMLAPKGTPVGIIEQLNREMATILEQPDVIEKIDAVGYELLPTMTPAEFREYMIKESAHYGELTAAAGIKPE